MFFLNAPHSEALLPQFWGFPLRNQLPQDGSHDFGILDSNRCWSDHLSATTHSPCPLLPTNFLRYPSPFSWVHERIDRWLRRNRRYSLSLLVTVVTVRKISFYTSQLNPMIILATFDDVVAVSLDLPATTAASPDPFIFAEINGRLAIVNSI